MNIVNIRFAAITLLILLLVYSNISSAANDMKSTNQIVPKDTIQTLITNIGKDKFIKEIDRRIDSSKKYIADNITILSSPFNYIQIILISKHFKLGIDTLKFKTPISEDYTMSLYDLHFRGITSNPTIDTLVKNNIDLDKVYFPYLYKRGTRYEFESFCHLYEFSDTTLQVMYIISEQNIQKKLEIYGLLTDAIRKGCSKNNIYLPVVKDRLKNDVFDIMEYKVPEEFMDKKSVLNPIKAIAYTLYAKDINLKEHGKYILFLLNNQQKDGSWKKEIFSDQEGSVLSTIFGLWALCEIKEQCKAL